ncbi:MAG: septum formation initiator family protein [Candidatus Aminicenantes bacterium]|nr:septum formation initiator family protein [Candidatus Aminicenantes bacterium]
MGSGSQAKKSFRNKLLTAVFFFLFLVLIIASFFGKKGLIEVYNAQKRKDSLFEEIEQLEKTKKGLEREIKELESNPKSYEAKARDQLGLVYPDEILIIKAEKTNSKDKSNPPEKK